MLELGYFGTSGIRCIIRGLFKVEWTGDAFIGLNAKTYFCSGDTSKYSSKGVSHSCKLTFEDYRNVLLRNEIEKQTNTLTRFRLKNGQIYTYNVKKTGLTHLYVKRRVLSDGVSLSVIHKSFTIVFLL